MQELITADHTFVNERLARHYGMGSVHGPQFRRVTVEDDARRGLLGKGAVLLRTSYGDRTSPVLRGAWVLDKLMGTPPTPPPPNVETDLRHRPARNRRRFARGSSSIARTRPATAATASSIRTAWRSRRSRRRASGATSTASAEEQIDAATVLPGGQAINGPIELRPALLRRPDQFVQALTTKLMMYALGRELEYFDMPQVRAVVRAAEDDDYRFADDRGRHRQ